MNLAKIAVSFFVVVLAGCGQSFESYDRLSKAISEKDVSTVRELVDSKSVKESLRDSVAELMIEEAKNDPNYNPLMAGMMNMIAGQQAEALARKFSNPESLVEMFDRDDGREMLRTAEKKSISDNRYEVMLKDPKDGGKSMTFVFQPNEQKVWRVVEMSLNGMI